MVISSFIAFVYENYHTSWGIKHSHEKHPLFSHGYKSNLELLLPAFSDMVGFWGFFCILTFKCAGLVTDFFFQHLFAALWMTK